MKPVAWTLLALLVVATVPTTAHAAYGAGSAIEADTPILLTGRTDALVANSVASFVTSDRSNGLLFSLSADELHLAYHDVAPPCAPPSPTTLPTQTCSTIVNAPENVQLTNAQVTLNKILSGYKVVATNDPQYGQTSSFGAAGALVANSGASTVLGATDRALHISPFTSDWTDSTQSDSTIPPYEVNALDPSAAASGGALRGAGGFQILLQGLSVRVTGITSDGAPFDRAYETALPASSEDATKFVVLETTNGILNVASNNAPLLAFGVKTIDVRGTALLHAATGTITTDGDTKTHDREDLVLAGPLSFTVTETKAGTAKDSTPRLAAAISSNLRVADLANDPPSEQDPAQLVAAGAAGALGAGILAAIVFFWPRLKLAFTLLALPLYTRIERTAVLEHEKRDEIYELIRLAPGIHAHEIGEKTHIGWGTTVYHLKMLEQHALVVSKKSGRYKRFFVNTGEYTKKKDIYGALRNETAKSVADYIVNHPGCNQKDMCAALGIQPSLASWHVEKLEAVELVKRVKDGRQVRYFAGAAWSDLNVRIDPVRGGADTPAET